jgi:hypothetical protein
MEKAKMVEWLLTRIGSKASELKQGYLSDEALEMVGDDIDSYLSILKDLVLNIIHPF